MKKTAKIASLFSAIAVIFSSLSALAQTQDKTFKHWTVYTSELQGKKTCYIGSYPKSKTGNYRKRDEPYVLVVRLDKNTVEVSTSSGYPYKSGSDVRATIDNKKYNMFTKGETAWAKTKSQDNKMVADMKKGNQLSIRGTSTRNTYSLDKYSLSGFTAAYNRMFELCKK